MSDVFVSYVSEDRAIAGQISHGLEQAGLSVWWDRQLHGGVGFRKEIDRQLGAARVVVVLWSTTSCDSEWVCDEAQQARDENKLIPVRLDGVQPPLGFRQTHAIDFAGWNGDPSAGIFTGLVTSVRHLLGSTANNPSVVAAPAIEPSRGGWRATRQRWFGVGIAVFVIVAAALWALAPKFSPRPSPNEARIQIESFEPLTKSDELDRFAKGMGATMVRVLATSGIKTIAPGKADAANAASNGGTEFAIHGRVDRDGADLVASADIVNNRDGLVLWSRNAKREAAQSQVFQEQFSSSIADVLRCGLHIWRGSNSYPSTDLLAMHLRLCEAWRYNIEQAPELTRRIVEAAPRDPVSYALQSSANALASVLPTSSGAKKPPAEIARLRKIVYESAQAVIAIDPKMDPYYARAVVDDPAVGLAEREDLLQKSIKQDPESYGNLYAYAGLLRNVGRNREARVYYERLVNANPLDIRYLLGSAFLAGWLGDVAAARRMFDDLRGTQLTDEEVDAPRFWAELHFGDPTIAKAINKDDKIMSDRCTNGMLDAFVAQAPLSENELDAMCPEAPDYLYGYFGHVDKAFRWAAANLVNDYSPVIDANRDLFLPRMRLVRADPRFMPLAARLGLVDYWLATDQWPDFCETEKLPYDCKEAARAARANAT